MASSLQKPVPHSTPTAARPVADARARALQEQIRSLREQARQAGDGLLQATDRNREQLLQAWEQAEQACRQAEQEMASLRAQSLGAAPASLAATAPAPALPTTTAAAVLDPDQGWDRRQAASAVLNLLERATNPQVYNSPMLDQGLTRPADNTSVTSASIDFGPLVEEAPDSPPPPARPAAPPAAAPAPAPLLQTPPAARGAPRPPQPVPVIRPAPLQTRARFGIALLVGALLGAGGVLAAALFIQPLPAGFAGLQQQAQQLRQAGTDTLQALRQRLLPEGLY